MVKKMVRGKDEKENRVEDHTRDGVVESTTQINGVVKTPQQCGEIDKRVGNTG